MFCLRFVCWQTSLVFSVCRCSVFVQGCCGNCDLPTVGKSITQVCVCFVFVAVHKHLVF